MPVQTMVRVDKATRERLKELAKPQTVAGYLRDLSLKKPTVGDAIGILSGDIKILVEKIREMSREYDEHHLMNKADFSSLAWVLEQSPIGSPDLGEKLAKHSEGHYQALLQQYKLDHLEERCDEEK